MHRCEAAVAALLIAAALAGPGLAAAASDPALTCRQTVLRGAAKLAHGRLVALEKCEKAKRAGRLPPITICRDQVDVGAALAGAATKLATAVDRACGGADKRCGGADDVTLAAMQWPSACPELEDSGCAAPLASCADVPACVACLADGAVTRGLDLVYAPFTFADRKTEKAIVRCQKALAAAAKTLADTRLAVEARCLAGRLAGKHDGACPVPGDGKTAAVLAALRAKTDAKVCKACGGADKRCGGAPDLTLAAIGVAPACPGIGTCDPSVASIADVVACFACTAAVRGDCALAGAAPGAADYPPDCAIVPPTPTSTTTATPTETATATPTLSPTPTITPSPVFCPAAAPGTVTTTVTLGLASGGTPIGGASLLLDYAPHRVRLPGIEDEPSVRSRIIDLTNGDLFSKGVPNNQDTDGDREPDRLRFSLVSIPGVTGAILTVTFDRCTGSPLTTLDDYACAVVLPKAVDGHTDVPTTCTLLLASP